MRRIYKIGILHKRVSKNPVLHVETRSKSDYKAIVITPAQTLLSNCLKRQYAKAAMACKVDPQTRPTGCGTGRF